MAEFIGFPKIARLSREIVITEKIDGTNGCIFIGGEDGEFLECSKPELMEYCIKQIIYLSKDREKLSRLVNNFRGFIRYA